MILTPTRSLAQQSGTALRAQFLGDVLSGLRAPVKELPCKYFYDDAGSALFEQITALDEYYLTRTEIAIMRRHAPEMAALLGKQCLLIEYGSGSGVKTRLLLDHLPEPAGYVPVDISAEQLCSSAQALARAYPNVEVIPVYGDFAEPLQLPVPPLPAARRVVYFPGSTIGNFEPAATIDLLRRTAALCGRGGGLLLGADLRKDPRVIELAYNDAQGVTAAFNLNLLGRINRELGADFVPSQFSHRAFYNETEGRIEMHLVSRQAQSAHVGGEQFTFQAGESVRTEYSYKYSLDGLAELAGAAGFAMQRHWLDERKYFCVCYFTAAIDPS
jgi:dimethylhistidine N-methyltransferase